MVTSRLSERGKLFVLFFSLSMCLRLCPKIKVKSPKTSGSWCCSQCGISGQGLSVAVLSRITAEIISGNTELSSGWFVENGLETHSSVASPDRKFFPNFLLLASPLLSQKASCLLFSQVSFLVTPAPIHTFARLRLDLQLFLPRRLPRQSVTSHYHPTCFEHTNLNVFQRGDLATV